MDNNIFVSVTQLLYILPLFTLITYFVIVSNTLSSKIKAVPKQVAAQYEMVAKRGKIIGIAGTNFLLKSGRTNYLVANGNKNTNKKLAVGNTVVVQGVADKSSKTLLAKTVLSTSKDNV